MPDHRQAGKFTCPLEEILLLRLLAVLAGAEAFTDIARFGEKKLDLFRPYRDGTSAHDHLGDIFIIWAILPPRSTRKSSWSRAGARSMARSRGRRASTSLL